MNCPSCGSPNRRYVAEEPSTHEHGPGGSAFWKCLDCQHEDFESAEEREAEKADFLREEMRYRQMEEMD